MNGIKAIKRVSEADLKYGRAPNASWHEQYRDSAYIYIGGLNKKMNEGDVVIVFSQFGEIVDCHMVRDKETGEPKGYCFIAYQDQRSTDLAVDNFNGIELCGRKIKVDHCHFRVPKEYTDPKKQPEKKEGDSDEEEEKPKLYIPSGPDGKGWGEFRKLNENDLKALSGEDRITYKEEDKEDQGIEKTPVYNQPEEQIEKVRKEEHAYDDDERWEKTFVKKVNEKLPEENDLKTLEDRIKELQEKKKLLEERKIAKKRHEKKERKKHHHHHKNKGEGKSKGHSSHHRHKD